MNRARAFPRHRRAFATVAALGLIAVVGVALAAVSTVLAGDVKRTARAAEDAQLRQLLVAGEAAARASLAAAGQPAGEVSLTLPAELASDGLALTIERLDGNPAEGVRFRVTARGGGGGGGRAIGQSLRYTQAPEGWRLQAADL